MSDSGLAQLAQAAEHVLVERQRQQKELSYKASRYFYIRRSLRVLYEYLASGDVPDTYINRRGHVLLRTLHELGILQDVVDSIRYHIEYNPIGSRVWALGYWNSIDPKKRENLSMTLKIMSAEYAKMNTPPWYRTLFRSVLFFGFRKSTMQRHLRS